MNEEKRNASKAEVNRRISLIFEKILEGGGGFYIVQSIAEYCSFLHYIFGIPNCLQISLHTVSLISLCRGIDVFLPFTKFSYIE